MRKRKFFVSTLSLILASGLWLAILGQPDIAFFSSGEAFGGSESWDLKDAYELFGLQNQTRSKLLHWNFNCFTTHILCLLSREMSLKLLSPAAESFSSKNLIPKNCLTLVEDIKYNIKDTWLIILNTEKEFSAEARKFCLAAHCKSLGWTGSEGLAEPGNCVVLMI
jgi:hypothetical protein